jgi:hypothetical protein
MNDTAMHENYQDGAASILTQPTAVSGTASTGAPQPQKRQRRTTKIGPRTNRSLNKSAKAAATPSPTLAGPTRELWIIVSVRRKLAQNQWGHQTSTMIINLLLIALNDGDKSNSTALLPIDGSTGSPLKKGHNFQAHRLTRYAAQPSPVSDPYFRAHIKLTTPHDDTELRQRLERFRGNQGAGIALIDPLQSPDKVAIGFFARSSPAMILRHYIAATNAALVKKEFPQVLLLWDSALNPPASEWDAFANIKPASALVAYATESTADQAIAGLRYLYSDETASPPLGRQMFFCPLVEFWSQPISFINRVFSQHLRSMMCEDIVSEVKGLRLLDAPFPDIDSTTSLRDLLLSARVHPDVPDSIYLVTSIEQSGLHTRFLFYEEVGTAARDFLATLDDSVKRHFDVDDTSLLYLPNYGPSNPTSALHSDFSSLQHLFPTTEMRPNAGLLTNDAGEPSSYIQTLLNGHATDSSSQNQQRRNESTTLARRGRRS